MTDRVEQWLAQVEARQLADLTFSEVSRSLRALSSTYVERRAKLKEGAALAGAGKRAAFALYYGPLHYLLLEHIVSSLGAPFTAIERLLDLGCGTGASGAGWAAACARPPRIDGVDRNAWAVDEARRTYAALGLQATARSGDFRQELSTAARRRVSDPKPSRRSPHSAVLLAFAVNEVASDAERTVLLEALLQRAGDGERVLVVEPLARAAAPWWSIWQRAFEARKGRVDEWRFRPRTPAIVEKLGRAAGLDYREIRGRTLAL